MFYQKQIEEIEKELATSAQGLSKEEVSRRQKKYGLNKLPHKKQDSVWMIFIKEFKDPIVLLLLFAIVASFMVGEVLDAIAILLIVLIDVIMGTYQENKANITAASLASLVTDKTHVIREGKDMQIPSEELTIGDYVLIESGDKISADLRIVEAHELACRRSNTDR